MRTHHFSILFVTALLFGAALIAPRSLAEVDQKMSIEDLASYLEENTDAEFRAPDSWLSSLSKSDYNKALGLPDLVLHALPADYPSQANEYTFTVSWHAYLFNARELITQLADIAVLVWIHDEKPVLCYPVRLTSIIGRKRYYEGDVSLPTSIKDGYPAMFLFKDGKVLDIPPSLNMLAASRWLSPDYIWEKLKEQSPSDAKLSEAIVFAARSGNADLLELSFRERSKSPELLKSLDMSRALVNAVLCGQPRTTELVLASQKPESFRNVKTRCLLLGLEAGNLDCLDILLKHLGAIELKPSSAKPLFEIAFSESDKRVFDYLLQKGLKPKFSKKECSEYASEAMKNRSVDFARTLWDQYGADPLYEDSGDNAVYQSAGYADVALLEELENRGLPIDTINTRGYSPMHKACVTENLEALDWLIKRSPRFAHSFEGPENLVARSISTNKPKSVIFLLENGFDPNAQVEPNVSLLDYARTDGSDEVVNILIEHGAR